MIPKAQDFVPQQRREWCRGQRAFRGIARIQQRGELMPLVFWWRHAPDEERRKVNAIGTIQRLTNGEGILAADDPTVRDVILETLFASGSNLLLMPVQDVFGWRDRINTPATIGDDNWTWRMPIDVDALQTNPDAVECATRLRQLAEESGRL